MGYAENRTLRHITLDMVMVFLEIQDISMLIGVGLVAGFMNTIAGGGSLLTVPALMLLGLGAGVANGTNRVAVLAQSLMAARSFHRAGKLDLGMLSGLLIPTVTGAAFGASIASTLPDSVLGPLLLATFVVVGILISRKAAPQDGGDDAHDEQAANRVTWRVRAALFLAGFYGGFVQAGVGFAFLIVLNGMLRMDLARANALKVALVVPYTAVALGIFIVQGQVLWLEGGVVALASVVGASMGVHMTLRFEHMLRWSILGAVVLSSVAILLR